MALQKYILHKKAQEAFIEYHRQCYQLLGVTWNIRENMRAIDLAYMRETDFTAEQNKAKTANRYGDPTKFQNVTVPIIFNQVETAVTYQSSVFLTGLPIFGVTAAPQYIDQAMQIEAIIEENSIRGGWVREFLIFFNNAFKYNFAPIEVCWERIVTNAVETDVSSSTKEGKPKQVIWEGNWIETWDPYNTFFDTRVSPVDLPVDGDFIGNTKLYTRVALKKLIATLPQGSVRNIKEAFEAGFASISIDGANGPGSFYIPQINPDALLRTNSQMFGDFNWDAWASLAGAQRKIEYKNLYEVTKLYCRIIPSDFALQVSNDDTPQIWKLLIVNHQVVIYAERQTNAHEKLPVLIGQAYEDGLGFQTKSLAVNARPFQEVGSALVNSAMAARRKAISDRTIYDPSRISEAHINSDNPSAKIPIKPAAYGKPLNEAVYAFPFRDDQSPVAFQELGQIMQFANMISGQNPARQGQFVKGNKTRSEFQEVMGNANGRDQKTSMLFEAQVFTPLKEILKINTLQYQAGVSIYSPSKERVFKIDPVALRTAIWQFKVSDGLTPSEKLISGDALTAGFQLLSSSEPLQAGYNMAPMFSYIMKTQGADLRAFEKTPEQMAYEGALQQWQQLCMQLADKMIKAGQQINEKSFPPQPTPQMYNYVPIGNNVPQQQLLAPPTSPSPQPKQ